MPMNGVSDLELRGIIERAFLPMHCEVSCTDGLCLTIHFPADAEHVEHTLTGVRVSELPDARALADLVAQIRAERPRLLAPQPIKFRA
ncbi:DUF1652 domain-containing protein [Pseudomonas aegrilactucae]|uniref:DUF1652 domain-containing protein n=1 Tax=Pseudomonas aegrilactucae TaxID=2854028 RepID=A0A9Q2XQ04_9PSED|nr:DUF1652 domain-containing protein [Pseudomonas aegrilactucae]MBV6290230.1 DUF1652 domain-containing protein [Pseudomonas aegrilactucae]